MRSYECVRKVESEQEKILAEDVVKIKSSDFDIRSCGSFAERAVVLLDTGSACEWVLGKDEAGYTIVFLRKINK